MMKKQYISPATNIHKLRVEPLLYAISRQKGVEYGNMKVEGVEDNTQSLSPDYEQFGIDAVEGDGWGTI